MAGDDIVFDSIPLAEIRSVQVVNDGQTSIQSAQRPASRGMNLKHLQPKGKGKGDAAYICA